MQWLGSREIHSKQSSLEEKICVCISVTSAKHLLSVCIQQAAADSLRHKKNALFISSNNASELRNLLEHSGNMKTKLFIQWLKEDVKMAVFTDSSPSEGSL